MAGGLPLRSAADAHTLAAGSARHRSLCQPGRELPPLPGHLRAIAHSINNSGEIVGQSSSATGESRPVRWLNGVPQDLGVLGFSGLPMGTAIAINDAGDITGESTTTNGTLHAFLWRDGVMSDLGTAPSGSCAAKSAGTGINELGQVVGTSTVDCVTRPVTWVNGQLQILPPLDPAIVTGAASDINEAGEIIGYSGPLGNNGARAVLWRGGQVIPLGSLAGPGGFSLALDISDRGLIVGQSRTALAQSSPLHAVTFELPGAGDQLAELLSRVTAVGPGKSLQNKIRSAIASLQAGDAGGACSTLYAFLNEVAAQAGKKLTAMQAADFTAAAQRIRDVIGC